MVYYLVQCRHRNFVYAHIVQGEGPGRLCVSNSNQS